MPATEIVPQYRESGGIAGQLQRVTHALARMTGLQWLIFLISSVAFTFDVYEIIALPLILRPVLSELGRMQAGTPEFNRWVGLLIFVPAVCGGAFGMFGGYLTDRLGRRRVLFFSILLYTLGAAGAAYSASLTELLIWRCVAVVGVSVEFVAGVAWLAEVFPDASLREAVLGYSQAFSATGGFILSGTYYLAVTYGARLPEIRGHHSGWRYVLLFGVCPAVPLIFVRPFLPESPIWLQGQKEGRLGRPSIRSLFHHDLLRATIVSTVMLACTYAAAFGALQHIPRILPGLAEVRRLSPLKQEQIISTSQLYADFGQLAGRLAFAVLASLMIRPRRLLYTFLLPCLVVFPLEFFYAGQHDLATLRWGYFAAAAVMTGQMSFWGNYLPRLYPLRLRGTGESFASNIGGRMIGNGAAVLTAQLANVMPGVGTSSRLSEAAGIVGASVYLIALAVSFYLPAPRRDLTE